MPVSRDPLAGRRRRKKVGNRVSRVGRDPADEPTAAGLTKQSVGHHPDVAFSIGHADELKRHPVPDPHQKKPHRRVSVDHGVASFHHGEKLFGDRERFPDFRSGKGKGSNRIVLGQSVELSFDHLSDRDLGGYRCLRPEPGNSAGTELEAQNQQGRADDSHRFKIPTIWLRRQLSHLGWRGLSKSLDKVFQSFETQWVFFLRINGVTIR